jgi:hypothetical protein
VPLAESEFWHEVERSLKKDDTKRWELKGIIKAILANAIKSLILASEAFIVFHPVLKLLLPIIELHVVIIEDNNHFLCEWERVVSLDNYCIGTIFKRLTLYIQYKGVEVKQLTSQRLGLLGERHADHKSELLLRILRLLSNLPFNLWSIWQGLDLNLEILLNTQSADDTPVVFWYLICLLVCEHHRVNYCISKVALHVHVRYLCGWFYHLISVKSKFDFGLLNCSFN